MLFWEFRYSPGAAGSIFWDVTPCRLEESLLRLLERQDEDTMFFETSENIHQSKRRNVLEDLNVKNGLYVEL